MAPTAAIGGRYRVERLLGKGGMGAVYAVVDQTSGRRVALKRLSAGASPNVAALFEREYHTLAGLHHPCIVQVYDYGSDADGAYYSMELIDGVDLSRAAPMPWRAVCRDLRDVASILGVLHARQLLHRDLSPRNLLRSESGRLKLIDFGALASFGPNKELVGTPPFIAPEVLRNASLDQRVDLFALGALAYWLITGVHAFPARQLAELPELWEAEFTPPSELQALVKNELDEPVPHDLDALIASLLRIEPAERLSSTAELIDQLNSIADLEPESNELTVQGYLDSKAFVGRTRERDRVLAQLKEASLGAVQTVLVEGDAGVGRTRFLRELVVVSQLAGALPVFVDSGLGTRPYGIAEALVFELLRAMPEPVRAAAREHAAALSSVSRELHTELHLTARSSTLYAAAETRIRQLAALRDLVLTLSRDRPLAFFIDDFQEIDEESQALIAALAHAEAAHKLTIVAALGRDDKRETSAALSSLRTVATRLRLLPLNREELSDLLGSVFGRPPYLERLSERLYRASDGNPAYCLELARHLVQSGLARYQDGMWSLPADLAPESLPKSRQAAHLGQLERLSPDARELARLMSIPTSGALSQDECVAISELLPERVRELLAELEREGVLRVGASGYRFAHDTVQAALATELAEPERKAAHLRLGTRLAATSAGDVFVELDAAVHLLRGGDLPRAYAHLKSAVAFYGRGDLSSLNRTAPLLEESYRLLREREQDVYGTVGVLGLLAIAGYFADRKYAARYGDLAVTAYRQVLRFSMLERLTRFVGGKLALIVTLVIAGLQLHRRRQRTPPFKQLMRQFMGAMGSLAGTAACSIDPDAVDRYAAVLRPFTVLGKDHAATITYRFSANFGPYLRDLPSASDALLRGLLARLESPVPIRDLPNEVKVNFIAGTLFAIGIMESWRDASECLQIADRLEQFSPLYAMSADHLRASYYASQGDLVRAEQLRRRIEVHAIQLGSTWLVETWAPAAATKLAWRANDPGMMKRAVQELGRLSAEIPSMVRDEQIARGAYLVLRHKYERAIAALETDLVPASFLGWAQARGMLARAYNELGKHDRAREICVDALSYLTAEDLTYVVYNMNLQVELALAEAGLEHFEVATRQLDDLLAQHTPKGGPLTLGALHQARARVALRQRDFAFARAELTQMEAQFRATNIATLIKLIEPLKQEIDRTENPRAPGLDGSARSREGARHTMTRVQLMLSQHSGDLVTERARRGLQVALELSSADEGFLVMHDADGQPIAQLGNAALSPELVAWAQQSMIDASFDEQTLMTSEVDSVVDSNFRAVGAMRYCVLPLWAHQQGEERVVAALVLGFENRVPRMPDATIMRAIAAHLLESSEEL